MSAKPSFFKNILRQYRIIHSLPGRMRIHIPLLEKLPSPWHEYAEPVAGVVKIKRGIQDVTIQPISGRVLIIYKPELIGEQQIKEWLTILVETFLNLNRVTHCLSEEEFVPLLNRIKIQLLSLAN
jgi:hypothetical protein